MKIRGTMSKIQELNRNNCCKLQEIAGHHHHFFIYSVLCSCSRIRNTFLEFWKLRVKWMEKLVFHLLTLHNIGHYIFIEETEHSRSCICHRFILCLGVLSIYSPHFMTYTATRKLKDFYQNFNITKEQLDLFLFFSHV